MVHPADAAFRGFVHHTNKRFKNETTFKKYTDKEWQNLVIKLDSVQTEWERVTEKASDDKLTEWSSETANMTAHNAYHTGQIIYIRKQNGWWK